MFHSLAYQKYFDRDFSQPFMYRSELRHFGDFTIYIEWQQSIQQISKLLCAHFE